MKPIQIVIDTNVLISALRSKRGASYRLLRLVGSEKFEINISVPLVCEYEQMTKNLDWPGKPARRYIDDILDFICSTGNKWKIYFLWRPRLSDPKDDMVLEVAVASRSDFIITYNKTDFRDANTFGIGVLDPKQFLEILGAIK
jgi:putative PIN family toxin of toxin-antitoxin system